MVILTVRLPPCLFLHHLGWPWPEISLTTLRAVGRNSVDHIVTRHGLDGPGIESRWGRNVSHLSRPALGSTQPPLQWEPWVFPEGKAARAWPEPPTPSSAEVKRKRRAIPLFPLCAFAACYRVKFTFTYTPCNKTVAVGRNWYIPNPQFSWITYVYACYLETAKVFFAALFHVTVSMFQCNYCRNSATYTTITNIIVILSFTCSLHTKNLIHNISNFF
jgi:hypothetical protein